jgi:hypothetical protein
MFVGTALYQLLELRFANVACIIGKRIIGGGARLVNYTGAARPVIFESGPQGQDGWFVGIVNTNPADTLTFKTYAICVSAQ